MDALKDMFNKAFYESFAAEFSKADKRFDKKQFVKDVTKDIDILSLNQRMRNTSVMLKKHLPDNFKESVSILTKVIPHTQRGYTNLVFPDFVGSYGLDDFDTSLNALRHFTQFGSSEFAIREFLRHDFERTIKIMYTWAKDKNVHVRRLSSEGSRPRLPWSFKLGEVIKDPAATRPILEALKADEELYVKKSVANHLNDISKEHPEYMLKLVGGWDKSNSHTAWIIKHASRSLIKKGHAGSLAVFDFEKNAKVKLEKLKLSRSKIKLGDMLEFEFDLVSDKAKEQKLVVDYVIHYRKKSGALSPKVFKLKEVSLEPKQRQRFVKSQLFKDFTTRTHFAGRHVLEVQVNGKIVGSKDFEIIV